MDYVYTDAGRSASKRDRQNNDCTVRAVALAYDMAYDDAYDLLAGLGRKCGKGFFLNRFFDKVIKSGNGVFKGKKIAKYSFPSIEGKSRMNLHTLSKLYSGAWIPRISRHMNFMNEGVVYDEINPLDLHRRCVYTAYRIVPLDYKVFEITVGTGLNTVRSIVLMHNNEYEEWDRYLDGHRLWPQVLEAYDWLKFNTKKANGCTVVTDLYNSCNDSLTQGMARINHETTITVY